MILEYSKVRHNADEIRAAVKAYRLYKGKLNIDEVYQNFHIITGTGEEE